jgi:hypothetical protein
MGHPENKYNMPVLEDSLTRKLVALATELISQEMAKLLVAPYRSAAGFWFGGGNIMRGRDGVFYLVGRYRNQGDSRTGLGAGERGLELSIWAAERFEGPYEKLLSFSKEDLQVGDDPVLSIEGSCLHQTMDGIELYISSEKDSPYPPEVQTYQKPGTGIWSIDMIIGEGVATLDAGGIQPLLTSETPATLHIKDPTVFDLTEGRTAMLYCTHQFSWTSSNTGLAVRRGRAASFVVQSDSVLPRGFVWDVAATRVTARLQVPKLGAFASLPSISLYFYDGAECLRRHEPHTQAVSRPRGYSCEELGGLAWGFDTQFPLMHRLSSDRALFISPHGSGCSRYVTTLVSEAGVGAAWQQSQPDLSQPLVGRWLPMERVAAILA